MRQIKRFKELWYNHLIFRWAVIVHLSYFIISLICVLTILREQNDFLIYFTAGGVFYNDTQNLYVQEQYLWDYRYLPLSAAIFVPFYLLGFDFGFIVFHFLNLIVNILICSILYKLCNLVKGKDHEQDDKRVIMYISFYLMAAPHMFNYILGQINLFISYFILLALYFFLKHDTLKWNFIASLFLGFSIIVKPTAILMIPFLIVLHINLKENKKINADFLKTIIRIIGVILPVSSNLIIFIIYPNLWDGFIETNFTGSNPLTLNFSFSITKLILNFCYIYNIPFNQLYILIGVTGILMGIAFIIFTCGKIQSQYSMIYGLTYGMLIILLAYFDSWDHHLLNLIPLLIIIIFNLPRHSDLSNKYIKKSLFFFSFFSLGFFALWFLTMIIFNFPYNFASTVFLILVFYALCKYGIKSSTVDNKN